MVGLVPRPEWWWWWYYSSSVGKAGMSQAPPVKRAENMELKFKGEKAVVGTATSGRTVVVGVKGFPVMTIDLDDPRLSPEVVAQLRSMVFASA